MTSAHLRLMLPLLLACGPPVAAEAPVVVPLVPANPVALAEGVRLYVDRDSVADAFPLGDRVIQRTPGGVIVVRRRDLSVARVVLGPAPAAAIGPDGDRVVVAWADGGTATLDPETGVLTKGPTVTGAPIWVGRAGDRVVVALGDDLAVAVLNLDTGARRSGRIRVDTPVPLGRPDAMVASPAAAPLSAQVTGQGPPRSVRNQRSVEDVGGGNREGSGPALWLGWDNGEWGGVIARVDLRDGHVDARGAANISGFTTDGERVLAFGGVDHLGMRDAWIGVAGSPDNLFSHGSYGPTKPGPDAPIHHVLPTPTGFTVLSFSDVWETDATFTTWRKAGELRVHYRGGRPDAVGTYGSVVDAWRDGDGLVLATRYDGFLRFTPPDRTTEREVAPNTGGHLFDLLAADGLVAIVDYTPYRLGEGGLEAAVPAPSGDLDDAWDTDGAGHLRRTTIDGNFVTTTVWAEPVTSVVEEVYDASYVLRDGLGALYVDAPRAGTRRQVDGRWTPVELPVGDAYLFAWRGIPGVSGLFRRHRGGPNAVAVVRGDRLTPLPGSLDATAWDGAVALLTTSGLVRWDPASDRRSPIPFPLPEQPLRVTQDGCGRLWVAGRTLVTPDMSVSIPGLDGRAWTAMVGLPDGVGLTDGAVIAELRRACR